MTCACTETSEVHRLLAESDADTVEHGNHAVVQFAAPCDAMNAQWFADDLLHSHARVQRAERILKDHLHLRA